MQKLFKPIDKSIQNPLFDWESEALKKTLKVAQSVAQGSPTLWSVNRILSKELLNIKISDDVGESHGRLAVIIFQRLVGSVV